MWPKSHARSYLTLVPSSMRMPGRTYRGWPEHYPIIHPWSEVRYHPTPRRTAQFEDSIRPVCVSTFNCLFIQTQPTHALSDTSGGYHLEAPNIRSDHSPSFPSSILHFPLIALPVSNYVNHSIILLNYIRPPSIEWPCREQIPATHLLPIAYTTKHSTLSLCFVHRGKQIGSVRVFLVQLGFHQTAILKFTIMA
jgi:hypothetical protein